VEVQLAQICARIAPPSAQVLAAAHARLDTLTKPLGSLGRLEDLAAQWASIRQRDVAGPIRKAVYVFAADHGVTAEGVSAYPREVTYQMVLNFVTNGAAINVLARLHHAVLHVVDVGVDADFHGLSGLIHRKVARGTANMFRQPAMTDDELQRALGTGIEQADEAASSGFNLIAVGEMGIGNTTSAAAITCALTNATPDLATGRGTGIDDAARAHKVAIVEGAVRNHFSSLPNAGPLSILRCVGGLEIAAMVGMILGAAGHRIAVLCDGFISTAAAALAVAIEPNTRGYLIAGHQSLEPGHRLLLEHLGLLPLLSLDMRLGEGTGAVLAMSIVESAVALFCEMATFESARVSGVSE
jgi:nicotinate-nucleotide--dimethylbenzimidazole phosphoribosyltransferase